MHVWHLVVLFTLLRDRFKAKEKEEKEKEKGVAKGVLGDVAVVEAFLWPSRCDPEPFACVSRMHLCC